MTVFWRPSMKGCSRKSSDLVKVGVARVVCLPLNERLLPKEQRLPLQKQGDKQGFFSTKRALI